MASLLWSEDDYSKNIISFCHLPSPEDFYKGTNLNLEVVKRECDTALKFWYGVLSGRIKADSFKKASMIVAPNSLDLHSHTVAVLIKSLENSVTYYDFLVSILFCNKMKVGKSFTSVKGTVGLPPGMELYRVKKIAEYWRSVGGDQTKTLSLFEATFVTYCDALTSYLILIQGLYFIGGLEVPISIKNQFLVNFQRIVAMTNDAIQRIGNNSLGLFISKALQKYLWLSVEIYENMFEFEQTSIYGIFSEIRSSELPSLAKRTSKIIRKYGAKNVEVVFENQIELIMKSFGFFTVRANIGKRSADLICISNDSRKTTTILVEAKTSSKSYQLPSKDERAIAEYVDNYHEALPSLPRLSLVILIGHGSSKSLEKKIKNLEMKTKCPVRFMNALDLANLREMHLGPISMASLVGILLKDSHIVSRSAVASIVGTLLEQQKVHKAFVEGMFQSSQNRIFPNR